MPWKEGGEPRTSWKFRSEDVTSSHLDFQMFKMIRWRRTTVIFITVSLQVPGVEEDRADPFYPLTSQLQNVYRGQSQGGSSFLTSWALIVAHEWLIPCAWSFTGALRFHERNENTQSVVSNRFTGMVMLFMMRLFMTLIEDWSGQPVWKVVRTGMMSVHGKGRSLSLSLSRPPELSDREFVQLSHVGCHAPSTAITKLKSCWTHLFMFKSYKKHHIKYKRDGKDLQTTRKHLIVH